jgi:hypothetical protein
VKVLEQCVLEYAGFSVARGRCHVVFDRRAADALVGDPRDNPGTSVTNAIEQVASALTRTLSVDLGKGRLHEYVPWDPRMRGQWTARVDFRAGAWSMPVWNDADLDDPFLAAALMAVDEIQPYALSAMTHLDMVNRLVRLRIEAPAALHDLIASLGTIEHISQRRLFYVDVEARNREEALETARRMLAQHIDSEQVQMTTPNAPLDQPGTLPG